MNGSGAKVFYGDTMGFAQISGWVGILFLAASFCIAIKSPLLSKRLGGYRCQIRIHHWLGILALLAMFAHLGVLLLEYSSSMGQLFDVTDIAIWSGWIALICTLFVVARAFRFRSAPYRRWRQVHLILILSFLVAIIHSFLILEPRTVLEWLLIGTISLVGVLGIVWGLGITHLPFFGSKYSIIHQTTLQPDLFLQVLKPNKLDQAIKVEAGQFVYLRYDAPQFSRMWHPFTVVGFGEDGEFELLTKARGRDTNQLYGIQLPCEIRVNGPFGSPFWVSKAPQIWIAYGVGIAIFLAASRQMPRDFGAKAHLVYCERNWERIIFRDEFDGLSLCRENFSWEQYYGEGPEVLVDLEKNMGSWAREYEFFRICGHPGFQAAVRDLLIAKGIPKNAINLEGVY
jgi:predicted ferric reductase